MWNDGRTIVAFTAILAVLSTTKADIRRDCRKQTHVSWAALKKLKAGNFDQDDSKLKCYLKCFMRKSGYLDENNEVDLDRALRHLPSSLQASSRKIFQRCKSIQGKNPCDKAFEIAKCYVRSEPQILKNIPLV